MWKMLFITPKPVYVMVSFFVFLAVAVLISTHMLDFSIPISEFIQSQKQPQPPLTNKIAETPNYPPQLEVEVPLLNCTTTQTCPRNYPTSFKTDDHVVLSCPEYFRWIHEDLRPWKATGITEDMIARASSTAAFRLTIVDGRVYIHQLRDWWMSRAALNIWGFLQLLRRYPGKLPDLDLMFDCEDRPAILKKSQNGKAPPPPLFTYCSDDRTFDIVFPDWSFWGWPEINIKPWNLLLKELEEGNKRIKWADREPHAYWKGNPAVARTRRDLLKCNITWYRDWKARLFKQDWIKEMQQGFKDSNIADKCTYKYNIYIEGNAWSVSGKYILACDSVTLVVTPHFYDFFTRSLVPLHHYWPVRDTAKCKSIRFAVNWGESHQKEAEEIGKTSAKFISEELKMEYVYDYMFHLLNEYAKLLKFKPTVPPNAVEYCYETMACEAQGLRKQFMMDSLVKGPATRNPCSMPPPYDSEALLAIKKRQRDSIKKVENKETSFW